MAAGVSYSDVEAWLRNLPDQVFTDVEQMPDSRAEFNFLLTAASGATVNVVHPESDGPVLVGTNCTLEGDTLDAVRRQREQFFAEVGSVLATTPGIYAYTDDDGNTVPDGDFTTITLRHWIYPDGLTEHTLNSSVIEMLNSVTYAQDSAARLATNPDAFE